MNYEYMWNLLKIIVKDDYDIYYDDSTRYEFHRGVFDEVQTIQRRMDEIEHLQGDDKE